jgi:hypothetical protein
MLQPPFEYLFLEKNGKSLQNVFSARRPLGSSILFPFTFLIDGFNGGYSSCTGHRAGVYYHRFKCYKSCSEGPAKRWGSSSRKKSETNLAPLGENTWRRADKA